MRVSPIPICLTSRGSILTVTDSTLIYAPVYPDGRVCISILHPPGDDPMGYELSSERWSPVQSVEKILLSVVSMLSEPNDESGANIDASVGDRLRVRCHVNRFVCDFSVAMKFVRA
ncbi:hypothetical protein SARC_16911 [Sphaeroforma arctica JP610]|uniref:UBC core domain-containing protein n=1 Tax=Sphaeroforma arctica JP610 TaxID=667725 RepID=A0A0L0F1V3_9EUKA|nr:hypothetical protein SARC_16911 [Sphaeroforma arctica JP610]KNC70559.1 hypothetical protein SARC_16911 [Sphaeroforma arctica JP610]|eukprot:XP_014144461.1 hypothetical protein SARC_16911 [Sphaeroforma arctica JP610]